MTQEKLSLKQKLDSGVPTFGVTMYSGSSMMVEIAGNHGLDFAFIDAEHTPSQIDQGMEKLILSAKVSGIAPLIRVSGTIEWEIRKALEFGAAGVIIPQLHTADQARAIVRAAKFPPLGRRGGDSSVRAARFAAPGFKWSTYTQGENENTLVIPMAESFEFFDNIDEILAVEGLDVINFGPADYSLSRLLPIDYSMSNPEVNDRLDQLIEKCHALGIKVMAPCIPPTQENAAKLVDKGVDMIIMGNDTMFLNQGCQKAAEAANSVRSAK